MVNNLTSLFNKKVSSQIGSRVDKNFLLVHRFSILPKRTSFSFFPTYKLYKLYYTVNR